MVFISTPPYLDPSLSNWKQQNRQQGDHCSQQHLPPPRELSPPAPAPAPLIRPGSMPGRADLARIATPEGGLKCPRCGSTHTKFCYYNNYSLSQPRHFCKTCRRYWTRGGALRNVPVGGGFRKTTKRSKCSSSKQSAAITSSFPSTDCYLSTSSSSAPNFMANLHHIVRSHYGVPGPIGLSYGGSSEHYTEVRMGGSPNGGERSISPIGFLDAQWRSVTPPQVATPSQVHQFPFLTGLGTRAGYMYPSQGKRAGVEIGSSDDQMRITKPITSSSGVINTQMVSLKMEDQRLNTGRSFMGLSGDQDQDQYWGVGNAWTEDLSGGFSSSSTANMI